MTSDNRSRRIKSTGKDNLINCILRPVKLNGSDRQAEWKVRMSLVVAAPNLFPSSSFHECEYDYDSYINTTVAMYSTMRDKKGK